MTNDDANWLPKVSYFVKIIQRHKVQKTLKEYFTKNTFSQDNEQF